MHLDEIAATLAVRSRSDDVLFATNLAHAPLREEDVGTTGVIPGRTVDVVPDALVGPHVS